MLDVSPIRIPIGCSGQLMTAERAADEFGLGDLLKGEGVSCTSRDRTLAGWATTFGHLGPDGKITPIEDRERMTMDAARALGLIDWTRYLRGRPWNWGHKTGVHIGQGRRLDFHGPDSPWARANSKVGFYVSGALIDRRRPESYSDLPNLPDFKQFYLADKMWDHAERFRKGEADPLGFSVEGAMWSSPCKRRILWAAVDEIAVLPHPHHPDAVIQEVGGQPVLARLRKGMIYPAPDPCRSCQCPVERSCVWLTGVVQLDMEKGATVDPGIGGPIADALAAAARGADPEAELQSVAATSRFAQLVRLVAVKYAMQPDKAREFVLNYLRGAMKASPDPSEVRDG